MRVFTALALMTVGLAAWSCGGGSKSSPSPSLAAASPTAAPASTAPAASTAASAAPTTPADTGTIEEVKGIVGSINDASHTIQIDRLSGAPVTRITVDSSTVFEQAGGGAITLSDVHVSDRIVASGHLNDRQDALVATHVTVQGVLPGAQPGG